MLPSTDTHKFILVSDDFNDIYPDFAVTVSGDNMEPLLCEGDILLVKKQDYAEHGDLGIFLIDGVRRVKKMHFKDGYLRLSSLDINCGEITVDKIHSITCEGKVIKVLHPGECVFSEI
jgi:SOS-response transcriptional repressor LexA